MTRPTADFLIKGARQVLTCAGPAPRRGPSQTDVSPIPHGVVAASRGQIVFVGPESDLAASVELAHGAVILDASGGTVLPGFVDPHTHVVFGGDRREELRRRLAGATYTEIAAEGGGILSTVRATRAASEEDLVASASARLASMLACGTTTAEAKSGYGLEHDAELRMLRAVKRLNGTQPVELVPTYLGAHEIPQEYRDRRDEYVSQMVERTIPAIAAEGLAEWCDVFCEDGVYTPEESRRILEAGQRAGLKARIHADELAASGGSLVAAAVGARSADHLLFVEPESADRMAAAGVVATLLPTAAFYLKLGRFAPARMLIERGVPVALATDLNPGGGFSPSMPFVITLACFGMKMTLEEALVAATINAAFALDRHDRVGSLEVGKQMDAVVVAGEAVDLLSVGVQAIRTVIKRGRVVAGQVGAAGMR